MVASCVFDCDTAAQVKDIKLTDIDAPVAGKAPDYTFTKTEEHKCSPLKADEVKAACKEAGKKAYYFCPECGKNFEDSKCTKEIADVNALGVIAKLEDTGGTADCMNKAK